MRTNSVALQGGPEGRLTVARLFNAG